MQATDPTTSPRYIEPGWFTRNVFNRTVALKDTWKKIEATSFAADQRR